nr:lysoplasmalogenase [uncultured Psychroserpens sp.]
MLTTLEKKFCFIYSLIVLIELISGSIDALSILYYVFKPAIVISLLIFFFLKCKSINKSLRLLIILALWFSLAGDILLMFVDKSPNYFLFGLVAFLLAHIMYVIAFLKHRNKALSAYWFMALLMVFAASLFYIIQDGLKEMLVPVIIYMLVILCMSATAYLRKGTVSKLSYTLVFIGALFFLLSDSILALNKFYESLPFSNISIMLTYAIAQFLIILGIVKLDQAVR